MPSRSNSQKNHANILGKRPHNRIDCIDFTEDAFRKLVKSVSGAVYDGWSPNTQTKYLANYLTSLHAKTLIVEHHYIDRHFMEEVSLYYSKSLLPRQNWTTRVHVFSGHIDQPYIDNLIQEAAVGNCKSVTKSLQRNYCGYIVIRPLPSVPIGRTVLRHLEDKPERKFPTCYVYIVHFLGLELKVRSLAFQQQDRAVAACATTAIWSSLQRVVRREGDRPPTSWEITEAAVRHFLPQGRPFPSSGLTIEQMCEALRSTGFAPDLLRPYGYSTEFLLLLDIYLRSGIPVILTFRIGDDGHAVTVVGYAEAPKDTIPYEIKTRQNSYKIDLHNLACDKIYIHDDRLGPYARASFYTETRDCDNGNNFDQLKIRIELPGGGYEDADIYVAAAPLYPKLRTNAHEMFEAAIELVPLLDKALSDHGKRLGLVIHFERSGEYQESLYEKSVEPKRIVSFQKKIALSRYVGVQRWYLGNEPFMETVWDTTDTMREPKCAENLLGVVCLNSQLCFISDELAKLFGAVAG